MTEKGSDLMQFLHPAFDPASIADILYIGPASISMQPD
jgi:hypothetical protein